MRLNINPRSACIGNVKIHELSRVTELDAGLVTGPNICHSLDDVTLNVACSHESIQKIEKNLAIIVPCMNEEHSILEGVLHGIPHHCLIVLVSNSNAGNFKTECAMLTDFCINAQRQGIAFHQQDPGLAHTFCVAGMPHIIDNKAGLNLPNSAGRIRNGKGEAMMIGTALAKLAGKRFVGFIDADNFVPGAVHEYCKVFAAGLHHALHTSPSSDHDGGPASEKPLAMVRIKWKSKPKIVDSKLVAQESGRCSRVVNWWMNRLLTSLTGDDAQSELIQTANAGEHAMSIDLALQLNFATGYAVEPFQLINAWERSGVFPPSPPSTPPRFDGARLPPALPALSKRKVRILQIETLNPHIHDFGKGEEHIARMQAQGLSTIYHSDLASQSLKDELSEYMKVELAAVVREDGVPERARVYPPMDGMDFEVLAGSVEEEAASLKVDGE